MNYYPKSQVKTNQYTNGEEFISNNDQSQYVGYYWETSTGEYFTGKTPSDTPTTPLTKIEILDNRDFTPFTKEASWVDGYPSSLTNQKPGLPPSQYITKPTEDDYNLGEFLRYFVKKTNQVIYYETSKEDYDKLLNQSSTILYQLYIPIKVRWQLKGDTSKTNKNTVLVTERFQKLIGFSKFFKNNFDAYNKDGIL